MKNISVTHAHIHIYIYIYTYTYAYLPGINTFFECISKKIFECFRNEKLHWIYLVYRHICFWIIITLFIIIYFQQHCTASVPNDVTLGATIAFCMTQMAEDTITGKIDILWCWKFFCAGYRFNNMRWIQALRPAIYSWCFQPQRLLSYKTHLRITILKVENILWMNSDLYQ